MGWYNEFRSLLFLNVVKSAENQESGERDSTSRGNNQRCFRAEVMR